MAKILILGGGFAGLRTGLYLKKHLKKSDKSDVFIIDKNPYHVISPSLYEAIDSGISKDSFAIRFKKVFAIPFGEFFEGGHAHFIQGEVKSVDLNTKKITFAHEGSFAYDYIVFALGSEPLGDSVPGVKNNAIKFESMEDVLKVSERLNNFISQNTGPLKIVVCGGGYKGVHLAAELGYLAGKAAQRLKKKHVVDVSLFEAGPKILSRASDEVRLEAKKRLTQLGVMIHENSPIEEVGSKYIKLVNGNRYPGDLILWIGGCRPAPLIHTLDNVQIRNEKIAVDEYLKVVGHKEIFAVGEDTSIVSDSGKIPLTIYTAADQGRVAGQNILLSIRNKELVPYKRRYNIQLMPMGKFYAIVLLGKKKIIKGLVAWLILMTGKLFYIISILGLNKTFSVLWQEAVVFVKK